MQGEMGVRDRAKRACVEDDSSALLQLPDEILDKVIDMLPNPADRNSISLVCKRIHAIEGQSRETVLVSNCYAIPPSKLVSRFPNAKSITIKGKPRIVDFSLIPHAEVWGAYASPWVEVLVQFYQPIRHLKMKRMTVSDSDIELLVSACGTSLQKLELDKCSGFSTLGLEIIARTCRNLVVLNLSETDIRNEGAPYWLTTLANTARSLEVLNLSLTEVEFVEQHVLVDLATRCRDLRLCEALKINHVLAVVKAANKTMHHLGIGLYSQNVENPDQIAEAFHSCKELRGLSALWDLDDGSMMMVMPIAARLTSLDLTYAQLLQPELTDLLGACVNLEDLQVYLKEFYCKLKYEVFWDISFNCFAVCLGSLDDTGFMCCCDQCTDIIGDRGLRELGNHCTKLKRLIVQQDEQGFVTQHGLTAVAKGCFLLEKIIIYAADMTNKALETLANNCPGLSDIRICLVQKYHDSHPVSNPRPLHFFLLLGQSRDSNDVQFVMVTSHCGYKSLVAYVALYCVHLQIIELEGSSTLNLGVKALLMKCPKARRLALCFSRYGLSNVVITDEGMSYIGQYGVNLRIITLTNCGGSDVGLARMAIGCVKLRKLELRHCPFGDASKSYSDQFTDRASFMYRWWCTMACLVYLSCTMACFVYLSCTMLSYFMVKSCSVGW